MTNWQYASILNDGPATKVTLDALGADGWELTSVLQGAQTKQLLYVFKRPEPGSMVEPPTPTATVAESAPVAPPPAVPDEPPAVVVEPPAPAASPGSLVF